MDYYQAPNTEVWKGRISDNALYFHEIAQCIDISKKNIPKTDGKSFTFLGYACDEGVSRNQGRPGTVYGPDAVRQRLGPLSNHLSKETQIWDVGNMICENNNLEECHLETSKTISRLIENDNFPIVIGGGHDLAYAHFKGIKHQFDNKRIGIINFDAHFDLRKVTHQRNSGTPFYQILTEHDSCSYLCLGIQKMANNKELYHTASELKVTYIETPLFSMQHLENITAILQKFMDQVDYIYCTIDLDGFSSYYAPGVSAPSPMGFSPDIVLTALKQICASNKLISIDIVELNPTYDLDNCTARLAAQLVLHIIESLQ